MRSYLLTSLFAVVFVTIGTNSFAEETKASEVNGRVLILTVPTPEAAGSVNWGGLIIVDIPDSGSRPPQNIKVDGGKCTSLGHVRGVATNKEGKSLMGGGYTWYLFKAPADERSVEIEASYMPNGLSKPKLVKRHYQVQLSKEG